MKVVVTGGAGFIGANLCRRLASREEITEVVALDDLSSGARSNLDGVDARLHEGSILEGADLDACFEGAGSVVHLAARPSVPRSIADPMGAHDANVTGTAMVLEAVRRHAIGHVVVASSSSVYGANAALPQHENLPPRPMSPYAATKLATEAYALAWARVWGFRALVLRLFNVFGPLQAAGHAYAAVVPAFIEAALAGRPLDVHGDGDQTRDFTFVGSVTEVIARAVAQRTAHEEPVNLAFGRRCSLLEAIDRLESILGRPLERRHTEPRPGDVRDSQADQKRLRELFPDVGPVSLDDGLRATVDWFRSRRELAEAAPPEAMAAPGALRSPSPDPPGSEPS